jgi:site-specific DNA recombinase
VKLSIPCAIYTRKSSEEGLEQDFNSLHAQREACEAFILSQKQEGWKLVHDHYDDGGYSGGSLVRPGLVQLMGDITRGRIKVVVVYKVDRLTRSLADFAKLVEQFDAQCVSFVSVTQQFNTTSSMGRLTLNVLLSFAQFEREVTGERIRDKIAASKKKGMWMGGFVPMGYRSHERTLQIEETQAQRIRHIYQRYLALGNVRYLKAELDQQGWTTPVSEGKDSRATGGKQFSRGHLYRILTNPIYVGRISHKGEQHPGQHPAIIDQETWDAVQTRLAENHRSHRGRQNARNPSLLAGKAFDASGIPMIPTHAAKGSRRYRYYVSRNLVEGTTDQDEEAGLRIPAPEIESAVLATLTDYLKDEARLISDLDQPDAEIWKRARRKAREIILVMEEGTLAEQKTALEKLLDQVAVGRSQIEVLIYPQQLFKAEEDGSEPHRVTLTRPVSFRRSGFGIKLVIPEKGQSINPQVDQRLLNLIRRGTAWFRRLASEGSSPKEIANEEGHADSLVQRMIYVAFLDPGIVRLIEQGEQPASLTSRTLMDALPLPPRFADQRKLFGIQSVMG